MGGKEPAHDEHVAYAEAGAVVVVASVNLFVPVHFHVHFFRARLRDIDGGDLLFFARFELGG